MINFLVFKRNPERDFLIALFSLKLETLAIKVIFNYNEAIKEISTLTFLGSVLTATASRAGAVAGSKYSA